MQVHIGEGAEKTPGQQEEAEEEARREFIAELWRRFETLQEWAVSHWPDQHEDRHEGDRPEREDAIGFAQIARVTDGVTGAAHGHADDAARCGIERQRQPQRRQPRHDARAGRVVAVDVGDELGRLAAALDERGLWR